MAEYVRTFASGDVYIGYPTKRRVRDKRPIREQIADIITGYDCEWDNPFELADRAIKLARKP